MNRIATHIACQLIGISLISNSTSFAQTPATTPSAPQAATTPATDSPATPPPGLPACPAPASVLSQDPAKNGLFDRGLLTGDWGGLRKTLENDGFQITPYYTGEVFGNPSGGASQGVVYDGLFEVALDFDLERMTDGAVDGLTIHTSAYELHGTGLSPTFIHDFSNTSNIQGYNTVRLQELWLQKIFWDRRLSVKVGNIAIDTEFFQSASAALFINSTFGTPDIIANNVPNAPVYPVASPGVRIELNPSPKFYVMAGVFGADNNSFQNINNQNGTRFALTSSSGMLVMSEAGYLLNQGPNDKGMPGTYRIGSFLQTANYNTWQSKTDATLGTGSLQSAGANYGVYGVLDQQIYASGDQNISFFVRSGGAPSNTNFVDYYVDSGFNFTGFIPGRASDVAGLAFARAHVSHDFSDSQIALGNAPSTAESIIEATYRVQIAPWWTLQPDFQYVFTPSGTLGSHDATVIGLRTVISF